MKKSFFVVLIVLLLVSLFVFPSCTDDLFGAKKPESISIEYLSGKLTSGNTIEFSALSNVKTKLLSFSSSLKLRGGDYSSSIYWRILRWNGSVSTDASAAGKITIIGESEGKDFSFYINSPGTYEVIATAKDDQNIKKSIKIIVGGSLESLGITMEGEGAEIIGTITLYKGESLVLYPVFHPLDTTQTSIKWTSDSNSSVSLSEISESKGLKITAKAPGTTNITLSSLDNPSITKTITVKVSLSGDSQSVGASTITISPSVDSIPINSYLDITATIMDEHGNEFMDGNVSFTSSNPSAIKIDTLSSRTARLTALSSGSSIINAHYNDSVWKSFPLVVDGALEAITLSSSTLRLVAGDTSSININLFPSDTIEKDLVVSSSDDSIVSSSLSGKTVNLKAKGEGSATITVSSLSNPSINAETRVIVSSALSPQEKIQRIEIDPSSYSFSSLSGSKRFSAIQYYREDDGSITEKEASCIWSITKGEDILSGITNGNEYIVTPTSYGNAVIRATSSLNHDIYAEASIFVGGELKTLLSETENVIIKEGETAEIRLYPYPVDAVFPTPVISLGDSSIASVSMKGVSNSTLGLIIKGKNPGNTRADLYIDGEKKTSVSITVEPQNTSHVKKVLLSSQVFSLKQDSDPVSLIATSFDVNGNEVSSDYSFSILDKGDSVVDIKQTGSVFYISPKNSGSATLVIYSTSNPDASSSCKIEVGGSPLLSPSLRSLSLPYNSITLQKGGEIRLEARTIPLEAETSLLWKIEDPGIVEIIEEKDETITLRARNTGYTNLSVSDSDTGLSSTMIISVIDDSSVIDTRIARTTINDGDNLILAKNASSPITLKPKSYDQYGNLLSTTEYLWYINSPSGNVTLLSPQNGKGSEAIISLISSDDSSPSTITCHPIENPKAVAKFTILRDLDDTISPSSSSITIEKGREIVVPYSTLPENLSVSLSVSSPKIKASLFGSSISIKAEDSGVVTLTSNNGAKAEIEVNAVDKAERIDTSISHISLDREYLSYDISKKEMQKVSATIYSTDNTILKNEKVIWKSSNPSVINLIVNDNSILISPTGKKGYTIITATAENNSGVSASCVVEVVDTSSLPETLRSITLSSSSLVLDKGRSMTLSYSVSPNSLHNSYSYLWSSSDPSVVSVDNSRITAISSGTATIRVTAEGTNIYDECTVIVPAPTVVVPVPKRIELSQSVVSLSQEHMDKSETITATLLDSSNTPIPDALITWSYEDNNIARIETDGNSITLHPISSGTFIVSAEYGKIKSSATVTVGAKAISSVTNARGIVLSNSSVLLSPGSTLPIKANSIPGGLEDSMAFSWLSSDPEIAEIIGEGAKATIKAKKIGEATITVSSPDSSLLSDSLSIKIIENTEDEVTSLSLSSSSILFDMAEKVLTTIDCSPIINNEKGKANITWTLSDLNDDSISYIPLSVDGMKIAIAKKGEGKGFITASAPNGVSSKCYVEIIDSTGTFIPLSRISLDQDNLSLSIGESMVIKATPIPDNATDSSIKWKSEDSDIATVDAKGRVKAISEGTTTITAYNTLSGVESQVTVTVLPPVAPEIFPVSINLSTSYLLLQQDESSHQEVYATIIASDGSVYSGSTVEWSIDNSNIATIAPDGNILRLIPNNPGKTTITARIGNVSSSLLVVTGTKEITSEKELEKLFVIPSSAIIEKGKSQLLTLSSFPEGILINPEWSSSSDSVSLLSTDTKSIVYAKGEKEGNSTISVSDSISKKTSESLITVMGKEEIKDEITSILLDRTSVTLDLNEKSMANINATVFVGGVKSEEPILDWEYFPEIGDKDTIVLYPAIGNHHTISFSKNKVGSGYLKATNPESQMFALCYIKVIDSSSAPITLGGIKLSHSSISLKAGSETLLKAEAVPNEAATTILWSSSDSTIAEVTGGRVLALKEGKTLIRAYSQDNPELYDECLVTVYSDPLLQPGSITLSSSIVRVSMEEISKTIEATVIDTNGNIMPLQTVFWDTSSSDSIASFSQNGNQLEIKPINSGSSTITAYTFNNSYERIEAEAKLIIGAPSSDKISSISFDASDPIYLVEGRKKTVSVRYIPDKPNLKGVVWSSSSNSFSYTSDSSSVILEGTRKGEGTLTATTINNPDGENISSTITVITVEKEEDIPVVASLTLSRSALSFDLADKSLITITATPFDQFGNPLSSKPISWKVEEDGTTLEIVETQNGTISIGKGSSTGKALITAECLGVKATCHITVIDSSVEGPSFQGIAFKSQNVTMKKGTTTFAELEAFPSSLAVNPTWRIISGEEVISLTPTVNPMVAIITGLDRGEAMIEAEMIVNGETWSTRANYRITEDEFVTLSSLSLSPSWLSLDKKGSSGEIVAEAIGTDGNNYPGTVSFSYTPKGIIEVSPVGGNKVVVNALNEGEAWIKATLGNLEAKSFVTVGKVDEDTLKTLILTPSKISMKVGQVRDIKISTVPESFPVSNYAVYSSDPEIIEGTIEENTLIIEAKSIGNAEIAVKAGDIVSYVKVSVTGETTPSYITISPQSASITQGLGEKATFTATLNDRDGYRLSSSLYGGIKWEIDDPSIASLSSDTGDSIVLSPLSYGHAVLKATLDDISAVATLSVSEPETPIAANHPTLIALDKEEASLFVGDTISLSVLYKPTTLGNEYKGISWSSSDSNIVEVNETEIGKADVIALSEGKTTIKATSTENPQASTQIEVEVKERDKETFSISLDKPQVRMPLNSSVELNATLMRNGEKIGEDVEWSIILHEEWGELSEEEERPKLLDMGNGKAIIQSGTKTGYATVTASASGVAAKSLIEIYNPEVQGETLRGLILSHHSASLSPQETLEITATPLPEIPGLEYSWSYIPEGEKEPVIEVGKSKGYRNWIKASTPGKAPLTVTALAPDGSFASDKLEVTVIDETLGEEGLKRLTISPNSMRLNVGRTALFSGTLSDDNGDIVDEILGWRIVSEDGTQTYFDSLISQTLSPDSPISIIKIEPAVLSIEAVKDGNCYIEAYYNTLRARAYVEVIGNSRNISLSSSVFHLIKGEKVNVRASVTPDDASLKGEWKILNDKGEESKAISIINDTDTTATIMALDSSGSYKLVYSLSDGSSTEARIYLHDPSYGTGGISYISFASPVVELKSPWKESSYPIYVHYLDGTVKTLTPELLGDVSVKDNSFSLIYDDTIETIAPESIKTIETEGASWKIFVPKDSYSVSITPSDVKKKGNLEVKASITYKGETYEASMLLSAEKNFSLSLSSTGINLYTGGSALIKAEATLDGKKQGGNITYDWTLISETTRNGEEVKNDGSKPSHDKSLGTSIFTSLSRFGSGNSFTIGTKGLSDAPVKSDLNNSEVIWYSDDPELFENLKSSFPRTARFSVTAKDEDGNTATEYIEVTVRLLPEGYSYPYGITLSADKLTLTPPFDEEEVISAVVTDIEGKKIDATVEWWYQPVTDSGVGNEYKLDNNSITLSSQCDGTIEAYMLPGGSSVYFRPQKAGVYRMTARVRQNPQISATSVFSVQGDVTGIKASTGNSLPVTKGSWKDITAIFSPEKNLARDMFWAVGTPKNDGSYSWHLMKNGNYNASPYINFKANGTTGSVYGKLATSPSTQPEIALIYAKDTAAQSAIENHLSLSSDIHSIDGNRLYLKEGDIPVAIYSYSVTVDVEAEKTVYSFKVAGNTEIDPSSVTGSVLSYSLSADSSNTASQSFSDWNWVEAKLKGAETGTVYASSVPIDQEGNSLYLIEGLYYSSKDLKRSPDGTYSIKDEDLKTKGITPQEVTYYNSYKSVRRYIEGPNIPLNYCIWANSAFTSFILSDEEGTKSPYTPSFIAEIKTDTFGGEYILKNGKKVFKNEDGTWESGVEVLINTEAPLSSFPNGKMMVADGGTTYTLTLAGGNSPSEPVIMEIGLSDIIKDHNSDSFYFDPETKSFKDSDKIIYIGGRLISLGPGESGIKNNATTSEVTTDGIIELYEGGSAVLRLSYNPTYTHEKEVKWEVTYSHDNSAFSVKPSQDGKELLFVAKSISNGSDTEEVHVRATSISNPSVSYTFVVTIKSVVNSMSFKTKALYQTNKNYSSSVPIYEELPEESHPATVTSDEVYCIDYTAGGADTIVDGYEIEMLPKPQYGYEFKASITRGSDIGKLDTTDIDASSNKFRFIPKGRVYKEYNENGEGIDPYTIRYGDVEVKITCDALNYRKDFTIHYTPSTLKLVKAIDNPKLNNRYRDYWDTYVSSTEDKTYIYGMDCIVLYEGESFPITFIKTDEEDFFYPGEDWNPSVSWRISDEKGNECIDGSHYQSDGTLSGVNFTTSSSAYDENGLCGEVCTLLANKEGKYSLKYTFHEESPNGGTNTFHGSIPVYVISKINQPLAALLNETNSLGLSLIPENISKANADKWFLPSLDTEAKDINGITINISTNPLLKGRAYYVTKDILKNDVLLKNLDISSVTQTDFNRINDGTTFLIPQKGTMPTPLVWVDKNDKVNVTLFDEISFEDIVLTGECGVSEIQSLRTLNLSIPEDLEIGDWLKHNIIDGVFDLATSHPDNSLYFIALANLDLSSASSIIFPSSLSSLSIKDVILDKDTIISSRTNEKLLPWYSNGVEKNLSSLIISNSSFHSLYLASFPYLSRLSITSNSVNLYGTLSLNKIGKENKNTEISISDSLFQSISIKDSSARNIEINKSLSPVEGTTEIKNIDIKQNLNISTKDSEISLADVSAKGDISIFSGTTNLLSSSISLEKTSADSIVIESEGNLGPKNIEVREGGSLSSLTIKKIGNPYSTITIDGMETPDINVLNSPKSTLTIANNGALRNLNLQGTGENKTLRILSSGSSSGRVTLTSSAGIGLFSSLEIGRKNTTDPSSYFSGMDLTDSNIKSIVFSGIDIQGSGNTTFYAPRGLVSLNVTGTNSISSLDLADSFSLENISFSSKTNILSTLTLNKVGNRRKDLTQISFIGTNGNFGNIIADNVSIDISMLSKFSSCVNGSSSSKGTLSLRGSLLVPFFPDDTSNLEIVFNNNTLRTIDLRGLESTNSYSIVLDRTTKLSLFNGSGMTGITSFTLDNGTDSMTIKSQKIRSGESKNISSLYSIFPLLRLNLVDTGFCYRLEKTGFEIKTASMTLRIPNYLPENKSYIVDAEGYSGFILNGSEYNETLYIDEYNLGTEVSMLINIGNCEIYPFGKSV